MGETPGQKSSPNKLITGLVVGAVVLAVLGLVVWAWMASRVVADIETMGCVSYNGNVGKLAPDSLVDWTNVGDASAQAGLCASSATTTPCSSAPAVTGTFEGTTFTASTAPSNCQFCCMP